MGGSSKSAGKTPDLLNFTPTPFSQCIHTARLKHYIPAKSGVQSNASADVKAYACKTNAR